MNQESLINEFHKSMLSIYNQAKEECGYTAVRFLQMVQEYGGLSTAKKLLAKTEIQSGLTTLWECGHLDLSMEALVLQPRFQSLFSVEELKTAKTRLESYGYLV